ncbi:MAG: ferritin-like domain-containing protein [Bryobacteraceae bacterium]
MKLNSLKDLFILELQDLYHAENQILKALPEMAQEASNPQLRNAFERHQEETRNQVKRLEQVFSLVGEKAKGDKCEGIEGIIKEGRRMMKEDMSDEVKDAALISAAQRVEHYEMAGYGCVRTYADQLGMRDAASLLQETLEEEGQTDKKLSAIAESRVNVHAGVSR